MNDAEAVRHDQDSATELGAAKPSCAGAADEAPLRFAHSPNMPELLARVGGALWLTTYQAGKLIVLRPRGDRLSMLPRSFDRAMGLALAPDRAAVGTRAHVWHLENDRTLLPALGAADQHDSCFVPRRAHVTGDCRGHELVWGRSPEPTANEPTLWMVNTLFSCLCTFTDRFSFVPRWRPNFVTSIAGEDRCHLNGVALRDGRPRYVTALGMSNEPAGWRPTKLTGGCVIDVDSHDVLCAGLCMPHSPRWHADRLWVLNSGQGELLRIDVSRGQTDVVARFPGYPRGLALLGGLAFVGLSQVRETATFGGLPLSERDGPLVCGVSVVELATGQLVGELVFEGAVAEIFDVQLQPGVRDPLVIGIEKDLVQRVFSLPPAPNRSLAPRPELAPATVTDSGEHHDAQRLAVTYLGRAAAEFQEPYAVDVYYLRYGLAPDQAATQAAKLFVPVGRSPDGGWPISVWCHGLGDPAAQLWRWPWQGTKWQTTRGRFAGRWAHWGIATMTPWLPGDGPSAPYGTYSPFSLNRNGVAVIAALRALEQLSSRGAAAHDGTQPKGKWPKASAVDHDNAVTQLDLERIVIRTTCVASALLIHLAAIAPLHRELAAVRAYVADDFQPSIAQVQSCVVPALHGLPAYPAAAIRLRWLRALWSLFVQEDFPLHELVPDPARDFLGQAFETPAGTLARIFGQPLVPGPAGSLPTDLISQIAQGSHRALDDGDVARWLFAPEMIDFLSQPSQASALRHPFYRRYFAAYDPFFAENVTPFASPAPLCVIEPTSHASDDLAGRPSREVRFEQMARPKIDTLRSWGWNVHVSPAELPYSPGTLGPHLRHWLWQHLARSRCV